MVKLIVLIINYDIPIHLKAVVSKTHHHDPNGALKCASEGHCKPELGKKITYVYIGKF